MKKRLRYRVVSLVVVFCLVAAVFPLFVLPSFAADASRINVFALDWQGSAYGNLSAELVGSSPLTFKLTCREVSDARFSLRLGESIFFSDVTFDIVYFFNSAPNSLDVPTPNVYVSVGQSGDMYMRPTTTSGNNLSGFKSRFVLGTNIGSYPKFDIDFVFPELPVGEYYLTLLDFDPVDDALVSDASMFVPYWEFDPTGKGTFDSHLDGFFGYLPLDKCCTTANNPQFQKFQGDSIIKMYGGLNYSFIEGYLYPDFDLDNSVADSFIYSSDYFYFDVSLSLPGTLAYIDVLDDGRSIPFDLSYYATDTVRDVDIGAGTLSQQLTGSTLVPIGGSIAGGLVAVQPTGSKNVNYVLSTNYNAGGTSGNLDYDVDYGYRDTTYLDATTYEYDSTSSFLKASRLNLRFKASASAVRNCVVQINFVCMDNIYVNYERTFTEAGILNYNSNDRSFNSVVVVSNAVNDSLVSIDTEYIASKIDKSTDEVLAFLERFFPSSKSIVEYNNTLNVLEAQQGQMDIYENQMKQDISSGFDSLPTFDTSVSSYSTAMIFVSHLVDGVLNAISGFSGIFVIPILLGLFFFILQRVSGVTRLGRHSRNSDRSDKGGDSS